ncbi:hypothetical protein MJD09_15615 [bacterium]|nr:hypothetical protein [bacterium]
MASLSTEMVVYGPFDVPYDSPGSGTSKRIDRDRAKEFWDLDSVKSVRAKQGCYVFALATSKGYTPWYIGKASKTFYQEALHDHKLLYYNDVIYKGRKGRPVLFFVAKPGGSKKIPKSQIDDLETFLIQSAVYKNPELKNKQKTKTPLWGIRGVMRGGRGKAPENAKRFKAMLRIG